MKKYALLILFALSIFALQSCKKEEVIKPEEMVAPELPRQDMIVMPFQAFSDLDTTEFQNGSLDEKDNNSYFNWFHAGVNLVFWNTVLTIHMAVPVAAFAEAFNHPAIYLGNQTFQWTYVVTEFNQTYVVRLTGQYLNSNEVEWILRASEAGATSEFVYYSGIVAVDGSAATFTLNHQPANPQEYLLIEYQTDLSTDDGSIRYTNIIPGDPGNGNYIEYRVDNSTEYNRAYDVYGGNSNDFLEIQWNEPANYGRVKHPARFFDNNFHCWDTNLMDVEC